MTLTVKNLNAYYGDLHALFDINLEVRDNQVVALVGANSAGKSTLINCLSRTGPQRITGEIVFDGKHLETMKPHEIVAEGLVQVPEGRHVFPFMTVLENIELGAHLPGPRADMQTNLEMVFELLPKMKDRAKQLAGSLSGGEQQMLAIGRGLMSNPRILMLDEPTLGLAPIIVDTVFELIESIRKLGKTVLLVEQNVQNALEIADYAYALGEGKIAFQGTGQELLQTEHLVKAYMGI